MVVICTSAGMRTVHMFRYSADCIQKSLTLQPCARKTPRVYDELMLLPQTHLMTGFRWFACAQKLCDGTAINLDPPGHNITVIVKVCQLVVQLLLHCSSQALRQRRAAGCLQQLYVTVLQVPPT